MISPIDGAKASVKENKINANRNKNTKFFIVRNPFFGNKIG